MRFLLQVKRALKIKPASAEVVERALNSVNAAIRNTHVDPFMVSSTASDDVVFYAA